MAMLLAAGGPRRTAGHLGHRALAAAQHPGRGGESALRGHPRPVRSSGRSIASSGRRKPLAAGSDRYRLCPPWEILSQARKALVSAARDTWRGAGT